MKKSADRSNQKFACTNAELIMQASTMAVSLAYGKKDMYFEVSKVKDTLMRSVMGKLGSTVYVVFEGPGYDEIKDSCVRFTSISLTGAQDILYDFAARERNFENSKGDRRSYYFKKVADRIYYRRRPIPLM